MGTKIFWLDLVPGEEQTSQQRRLNRGVCAGIFGDTSSTKFAE
jgi:hypothetical protein